jgi:bifunctional non-homologous end joining protein LigD
MNQSCIDSRVCAVGKAARAHHHCKRLAQRLAATSPERYTVSAAMAKRPGRLFVDYLRNGRGTTAIGTYSPRVRPGFPIAAPIRWKQIERGIKADTFTMDRLPSGRCRLLVGGILVRIDPQFTPP